MAGARTDTTPYKGHIGLYATGFICSTLMLAAAAYLAAKGQATGWEYAWFAVINGWPDAWYRIMLFAAALGSLWTAATVIITAYVLRFYRLAWRLALSVLAAYGLSVLAKIIIDRARPVELLSDVHERLPGIAGAGFLSMHTAVATVILLSLLPYSTKWYWRSLIPVLIVLAGVSRLYLGVHLPLDVVAGAALGTAIVAGLRILPQSLRVLCRID